MHTYKQYYLLCLTPYSLQYVKIWKIWKKGKLNSEKDMENTKEWNVEQ